MRAALVLLLWPAAVWAQPVLEQVQPAESRANGIVFLNGSGFGSDKEALQVLFGSAPAKIVSAAEGRLSVQVPWEATTQCEVKVGQNGQFSRALPFQCLPTVRLKVLKNPLEVGEMTTARFQVYHLDRPMMIFFKNGSPSIVRFLEGNQQNKMTTGGADNHLDFQIEGLIGNQLYDVNFSWGTRSQEPVEWKLPWSGVPWTAKP